MDTRKLMKKLMKMENLPMVLMMIILILNLKRMKNWMTEDFDTEYERDDDIDTDTNSEFTVGEVETDTGSSSSHMVTVSLVKPSHAPMDAMTFGSLHI